MDSELEIVAAASVGGLAAPRAKRAAPPGSPCANCGTALQGPFCHACGQLAESFERSIWSLIKEAVESFFDADGRVLFTLPRLAFRPATLTKDYLAGRRAPQTPPLRLFLVVVVLVFFVGGLGGGKSPVVYRTDSAAETAPHIDFEGPPAIRAFGDWLNPRLSYAIKHQVEFTAAFEAWLHRIAIIFLPVATLLLGLIFVFNRRFYLFDHAIFSMHSLSFMGLLFSLSSLMKLVPGLAGVAGLLTFAAPTHLFFHMRGVYRTSIPGTLIRMVLLFILSCISAALLLVSVIAIELNGMGPAAR